MVVIDILELGFNVFVKVVWYQRVWVGVIYGFNVDIYKVVKIDVVINVIYERVEVFEFCVEYVFLYL